jgi:hypothetical protein
LVHVWAWRAWSHLPPTLDTVNDTGSTDACMHACMLFGHVGVTAQWLSSMHNTRLGRGED